MNYRLLKVISFILLFAGIFTYSFPEGVTAGKKNSLRKVAGTPNHAMLNINNISTYIYNDGISDQNTLGNSGFVYPKGTGKSAVYCTGFVLGGKVNGQVRVGGSTYQSGITPGRIIDSTTAQNPDDGDVRIYRVRRDWKTGSMSAEVRDGEGTEKEVKDQYEKDWNEWPATYGAPYTDIDGNGSYDPAIDIPGVTGADQTIWYVANDLDDTKSASFYGSAPMGIEIHLTVWGYSSAGPLGNMLFRKYTLINKSSTDITDAYVSIWSDPDNGGATDDYAGCDSTLSLAYVYNATVPDEIYGANPPAVGFDFFQGPIVDGATSDSGIFNGKRIYGKKNLPMSSFYYFINSDAVYHDPDFANYQTGALRFYNLLLGRISVTGEPFPIPPALGGGITKFPLSGDPVTGTGYLDGILYAKGDRRIGSVAGPFTLKAGDVQEVVVAEIIAGGPSSGLNNIKSVELLKSYDKVAQKAYDDFFVLPSAPEAPQVTATELNQEVILNWGSDSARVANTENHNLKGFTFQGYNVYQLPTQGAIKKEAVRIATYDIVDEVKYILGDVVDPATGVTLKEVQQFGSDNGISRTLMLKNDAFTNLPLVNGKKYYYAVTAYAYNPDILAVPNNLENPIASMVVIPHAPDPGTRYNSSYGDTLAVTRLSGVSEGGVVALVVDPKAVTGHDYKVEFENVSGAFLWKLTDVTTSQVKISKQTNQTGDDSYLIVDGIMVKVIEAPEGMKTQDMYTTNDALLWGWAGLPAPANRRWSWLNANTDSYFLENFGAGAGAGNSIGSYVSWSWFSVGGSSLTPDKMRNVILKFTATDADGNYTSPGDENISYAYRYLRGATATVAKPEFAPFIKVTDTSYAFQDFTKAIPFSAWDTEAQPNRRLAVGFLENNVAAGLVDGKYWPGFTSAVTSNSAPTSPREWFYIFDVDYKETLDSSLARNVYYNPMPVMYYGMPNRKDYWRASDQFGLYTNHINVTTDVFKFTSKTVTKSDDLAKTDVDAVNVFPNPYYAVNSQELNKYQRFVTFNHLPINAKLRVFNLAGQLVRTIDKDPAGGQFCKWDLNTDSGLPVASGLYIVHIDMPDLGKTKILKVAVIQEQQILDRF
ncbi:MAG: hypothetical protein WCJ01_09260 [Ignavibacteria bacterium]